MVVISQLALYTLSRSHPPSRPPTPPKHPETPQMTITNSNYEGSYLPGLTCNKVVRADLGRSTPPGKLPSSCQEWQFYISCYY